MGVPWLVRNMNEFPLRASQRPHRDAKESLGQQEEAWDREGGGPRWTSLLVGSHTSKHRHQNQMLVCAHNQPGSVIQQPTLKHQGRCESKGNGSVLFLQSPCVSICILGREKRMSKRERMGGKRRGKRRGRVRWRVGEAEE